MRRLASALLALASCTEPPADPGGLGDGHAAKTGLERLRAIPAFATQLRPALRLVSSGDGYRLAASAWSSASPTLDAIIRGDGLHLALSSDATFALHVRAEDEAVEGRVVDGSVFFANARPETDVVLSLSPEAAEELRVLRTSDAPHVLRWRVVKGPAVSSVRLREGRIEALDRDGVARIASQPMFAIDARGVRRDLSLRVLSAESETFTVETVVPHTMTPPIAVDPSWTTVGSMGVRRHFHMIAPLLSGQVLVAGGENDTGEVSSAEIYNELAKTWASTSSMTRKRRWGVMTALADGRALVVGNGISDASKVGEIYQPTAQTWSLTSVAPSDRRVGLTLTRLGTGKVLVVGGDANPGNAFDTADLYEPSNDTWTPTGSMKTQRCLHTATTLSDGRVLVAGGADDSSTLSLAEIYNPATGTWSDAAPMSVPRRSHAAARLGNGRVLVCGGFCAHAPCIGTTYSSCERYDPIGNAWSAAGSMAAPRDELALIAFAGGRAVAAGGQNGTTPLASADLYDSANNAWMADDPLAHARHAPAAVLLATGEMLITGGRSTSTAVSQTAEVHAVPGAVDAGPSDAGSPDTGATSSDTGASIADTNVADTKPGDGTVATDTNIATDTNPVADTNVATDTGTVDDAAPADGAPTDGAIGQDGAPADGAPTDGAIGGTCTSHADCPSDRYCSANVCLPREPRGDAPCGCSVPGADGSEPAVRARAISAFALLFATVCARGASRRRRRPRSAPARLHGRESLR